MRPYLAIIKDSFREAFASRVLWILLVVITLLLLALAPLGYREQLTTNLTDDSAPEWHEFLVAMRKEAEADSKRETISSRIWFKIDEKLREDLRGFESLEEIQGDVVKTRQLIRNVERFRGALNKQLADPELYDKEKWSAAQKSLELRNLLTDFEDEEAELSKDSIKRMNRLLIEAAYPDYLPASRPTSVQLRYLTIGVGPPWPLRRERFIVLVESGVRWVMKWFVGAIGIFVAVLVTAPIIPQTFDPGSLNLLLSKPIARSLLFLSKFAGGCAFTLINAAYLIGGAWVILGCQFGIWDPKLLLSIPIYLFMFAIYYAVSALAGVVYRSPIVAIAAAMVFWLCCFSVGTAKIGMEQQILNKSRITQLVPAGDTLLAVNEMGFVNRWNVEDRAWEEVFATADQGQLRVAMFMFQSVPAQLKPIGPVYDEEANRLVSIQRSMRSGRMQVQVGDGDEDWKPEAGVASPSGVFTMLREPSGSVLAVSSLGLYRLTGNPVVNAKPTKVFGIEVPFASQVLSGMQGGPFTQVGPEKAVVLTRPAAAVVHPEDECLIAYSRGKLYRLPLDSEGRYTREGGSEVETELDADEPVVLACAGKTVLLCREDGSVQLRDPITFKLRSERVLDPQSAPRFAYAAPGGRWLAVLLHNRKLWLLDTADDAWSLAGVTGQGDVSAAGFPSADELLVADRTSRVSRYRLDQLKLEERFAPNLGVMETGYYYALVPMYTVFPKPGELDKTIQYLLTGKATQSAGRSRDLSTEQVQLRPWAPVWSSLAFIGFVLVVACGYIELQEF